MLKCSKNLSHMHRWHASIVIKSRTVALFWGKIAVHFALFSDKFTRLARILHDRRSPRSRQISTLPKVCVCAWASTALDESMWPRNVARLSIIQNFHQAIYSCDCSDPLWSLRLEIYNDAHHT